MVRQILHQIGTSKTNSDKTSNSEKKKKNHITLNAAVTKWNVLIFQNRILKSPFQTHPLTYNLNSTCSASQIMPQITPVQPFSPLEELSVTEQNSWSEWE